MSSSKFKQIIGSVFDTAPGSKANLRQKELNIIYFIDAKKTKTVRISLRNFYYLLGVFVVFCVWSVASLGLTFHLMSKNKNAEDNVQKLLSDIFNYQVKYEDVYQKAYPNNANDLFKEV